MSPRSNSKRAFSIIEALIAVGLLTGCACVAYERLLATHQAGVRQLERQQAQWLARQELEQLRACDYQALLAWRPAQLPAPYPDHLRFVYQDQVTTRTDGLLELTVRVGWDMPANGRFEPGASVTVKGLKAR